MSNLTKISATWDKVWQDKNNLTEWDYLSQIVVEILISETPFIETTAIEVGSGSGRISHKLAQLGAKVTLLDISQQAIKEGEKLFHGDRAIRTAIDGVKRLIEKDQQTATG